MYQITPSLYHSCDTAGLGVDHLPSPCCPLISQSCIKRDKNVELADRAFVPVHLYWQHSSPTYWMLQMHSNRSSPLPLLGLQLFQEEEINCINQRLIIFGFPSRPDSLKSLWFFEWGSEWHFSNGFSFFHLAEQLDYFVIKIPKKKPTPKSSQEESMQLLTFRWQNVLPERCLGILWMSSENIHKRGGNYGLQLKIWSFYRSETQDDGGFSGATWQWKF